jgi:condensin-2 complex subunit D3
VLSDALAILSSPWIRVGKNSSSGDDDIEDPNLSTNKAKIAQVAKGRLLSNISRKHLIEILLPVLCKLKMMLQKSCSPLLKDLMFCIVDVYQRYKTEAEECLANDPTTLQEIQYDAQQHRKTQRQKTPGKIKTTAMKRALLPV